ncbi:heterodisulfide reductase [Rhodovulum sp. P5]|uniref:(Fe-S)-binding protein n=1 Tax=Rhodovulum sp. P5 TaxID=1564506 RepID=UPI0009C29A34|nr:(Fe-S)-binding protein [Rhodovulum sp. P5]ARE38818.1 heterodisulfide reductase [Rhodovulum sp. P5]
MNAPVDVKAATDVFLSKTEGHLVSFLDACVHCGLCAEACHFHEATGDPRHTPAYKLFPLAKAHRNARFPWSLFTPKLTEADLSEWEELLFDSCTMCGRCTTICPMGIDIASIIGQARQAFVAAGLGPADLMQAAQNSKDHGSPLGLTPEKLRDRVEWLEDENETEMPIDKAGAEVMLTVSSVEAMKYPDSLAAMAKILNHAGISWTFSTKGYEATNFGYLAGRGDITKTMTMRLVEAAEELGIKTLIIPECGHAYGVLRWAGANTIGRPLPFEVRHITEYMADLKRAGKLKLTPFKTSMTYHDPCQISRRGGAADDARYLLEDFAEDFREMTPTGNYNWCCGGGGGVQAIGRAAELRHKVFRIKTAQTEATGADMLVSSCSNCRLTMDESKTALNWQGKLGSLVEIIADHLEGAED